jgi:hypothetical protein
VGNVRAASQLMRATTILAAATVVIAVYVSDTFDNDLGWAVSAA